MPTQTTHSYRDWDRDRLFDEHRQVETQLASSKIEYQVERFDSGNDGSWEWSSFSDNVWSGNRLALTHRGLDADGNGTFEQSSVQSFVYDTKGRLDFHEVSAEDDNGDGFPDWQTIVDNVYDNKGRLVQEATSYLIDGELNPQEYRIVDNVYDNKGRLIQQTIDDPIFFDYIVSDRFTYDNKGLLTSRSHSDEFDYGDTAYHVEETRAYDNQGRLSVLWQSDEFLGNDRVASLTTKFSYPRDGFWSELAEGKDGAGVVVERQLTEHWLNAKGEETHVLVSHDREPNGAWDVGQRDLFVTTHAADGSLASETHDFTTGDGIIEFYFVVDPLVA